MSNFDLRVLDESGYNEALMGMSLSFYKGPEHPLDWWTFDRQEKARKRARILAFKQGGHNKFLESINVQLLIRASRGFWQEFDTYRIGTTRNSSSTMHTLTKRPAISSDFIYSDEKLARNLNWNIEHYKNDINQLKARLPEGYMQWRQVATNYKALQNILWQRESHRLEQWKEFRKEILSQVEHPYFLVEE